MRRYTRFSLLSRRPPLQMRSYWAPCTLRIILPPIYEGHDGTKCNVKSSPREGLYSWLHTNSFLLPSAHSRQSSHSCCSSTSLTKSEISNLHCLPAKCREVFYVLVIYLPLLNTGLPLWAGTVSGINNSCHLLHLAFLRKCIKYLVINHLIGIVAIIGKNLYTIPAEVFSDCCGTGSTSALPIFALANDIQVVFLRL